MEDNFKKSIDSIRPDDGARDRMMRRIRKKAEAPKKNNTLIWARRLGLAAAACLVVVLAVNMGRLMEISKPKPTDIPGPTDMLKPTITQGLDITDEPDITDPPDIIGPGGLAYYDSLDALNSALSMNIKLPENIDYVKYSAIGPTAQVLFSYKDISYIFLSNNAVLPDTMDVEDESHFYDFHADTNFGQTVIFDYVEGDIVTNYGETYWMNEGRGYLVRTYDSILKEDLEEIAEILFELN